MFCKNCGNRLNPGEVFCSKCGARVEDGSSQNSTTEGYPVQDSKSGKNNTMAILSIVFGVLGFFVAGLICGILAICMSVSAKNHIKSFPEEKGENLATIGLILGIIDVAVIVLYTIFA